MPTIDQMVGAVERRQQALKMRRAGMSYYQIAEQLRCNPGTLYKSLAIAEREEQNIRALDDEEQWAELDRAARVRDDQARRAYDAMRWQRALAQARRLPDGRIAVDLGLVFG